MIILYEEENKYLTKLLEKQPFYWCRDTIIEKLKRETEEKETIKNCEHIYGEFDGKKVCCINCGTHADGMGFEWELKRIVDKNDYETPKIDSKLTPIELLSDKG